MELSLVFFGSLRDPDLFERVAARRLSAFAVETGHVVDHRAERAQGEAYPVLVPADGARAPGLVVHGIDAATLDRISFYETTDYRLGPMPVEIGARSLIVHGYHATATLPSSGEPWHYEHWRAEAKPLALAAAGLAMAYHGRVGSAEIAPYWPEIYREAARLVAVAALRSA